MKRNGGSPGAEKPRPGFPAKLVTGHVPTAKKPTTPAAPRIVAPLALTARAQPPAAPRPAPARMASGFGTDSQAVRADMVRKLEAQGINDAGVLAALLAVERHRFVDSALANQAYEDTSLPIGLGQTISKPNVVARMLSLLCENSGVRSGRVLEIGTGCGYQAALLSHLSREVYSIERFSSPL